MASMERIPSLRNRAVTAQSAASEGAMGDQATDFAGESSPNNVQQSQSPTINVQGGDTKPVVGEIKNTNQLLESLLDQFRTLSSALEKSQSNQPQARGGRERTTIRPGAELARRY